MNRKHFLLAGLFAAATTLSGFGSAVFAQGTPFRVGVTPGPHAQIMEVVKEVAARDGLNIEIIEFSSYPIPNQALAAGELNANSFQHKPYLDNQVENQGFDLVAVADTVLFPMAFYSKQIPSVAEIGQGARIGIPNDPTNGGRALLLLQENGLITLDPEAGIMATPLDITANPLNLEIIEMDAAQMPRALDELSAAVINTNFAIAAGLNPKTDSIAVESGNSPYANVLVVRAEDKDSEDVAKLIRAYHTEEVKQFIEQTFGGSILALW